MGNYISRRTCDIAGKVILADGTVQMFSQPVAAGELMMEHPQQYVVEIRSVVAGSRPAPLPADQKLEAEKVYLMLPMRGGKVARLSADEIRWVLSRAGLVFGSRPLLASLRILPRFARLCSPQFKEEVEAVAGLRKGPATEEEEREIAEGGEWRQLSTGSLEKRPEFLSRELSCKGWKPSLDTIREKEAKKKVSHWLFGETIPRSASARRELLQ